MISYLMFQLSILESVESDEEVPQIRAIPCLCIGDSVQLEHGMSTTCGRCMALEKSGQLGGKPNPVAMVSSCFRGETITHIQDKNQSIAGGLANMALVPIRTKLTTLVLRFTLHGPCFAV